MSFYAIGIDLGTTNSCVAVYKYGKIEIIANDQGSRTTPSCVSIREGYTLVGDAAVIEASRFPKNTIYDAKRLIGRRYNDQSVQDGLSNWPFTVVRSEGFPKIEVPCDGETKLYSAEDISAILLKKMKETAENYLEEKITKVVITVPAYFNDFQKQTTINAGKSAGLDVMYILSEPVAAAITYAAGKENMKCTVMVFDLGGGTLDVSIVSINKLRLIVKSISGNANLGGQDFTNNLVNYFVELFKRKYNRDLRSNKRPFSRLRQECEKAKRNLSYQQQITFVVDSIMDGLDINEKITRAKFNELNSTDFASTLIPVKKALDYASMTHDDMDKVIMVGGSSRIPKIKSLLGELFGEKKILQPINADEAIAYGAGLYAAILNGINIRDGINFIIQDVMPQSLSLGIKNDKVKVIIPKSSIVPVSETQKFVTSEDMQTAVSFRIYEGESEHTMGNTFLGICILTDIPPGPKGKEMFDVTYSVDANRVLSITALHINTGANVKTTIDRRLNE